MRLRQMNVPTIKKAAVAAVGFLSASLLPAVVFAVLTPILGDRFSIVQLGLVPVFFVFSAAAVLLIGTPMFLILRALHLVNWWSALVAGCLGGAIVSVILRLPAHPVPGDFLIDCPTGAASAFVFWLILKINEDPKPLPGS
jgi:hypothetical protein